MIVDAWVMKKPETVKFFTVWDVDGKKIAEEPIQHLSSSTKIRAGVISVVSGVYDPLTGEKVPSLGQESDQIVGYAESNSDYLASLKKPNTTTRMDYGTKTWRASEKLSTPKDLEVQLVDVAVDYALFKRGYPFSAYRDFKEETYAINIPTGDVVAIFDGLCSFDSLGFSQSDEPMLMPPDHTKFVHGNIMFDSSSITLSCESERRGGFRPSMVTNDGIVFGDGRQGSNSIEQRVSASMKIGDG